MPKTSISDAATESAAALIAALLNPSPSTHFANIGNEKLQALKQLANIFSSQTPNDAHSLRVPISKELTNTHNSTQSSTRLVEPTSPPLHRYSLRLQQSSNSAVFPILHQENVVTNSLTGKVQKYRHLIQGPEKTTWVYSLYNKLGCLFQGVVKHMPTVSDTCFFIKKSGVPQGRKVTYGRIVAMIRLQKEETYR